MRREQCCGRGCEKRFGDVRMRVGMWETFTRLRSDLLRIIRRLIRKQVIRWQKVAGRSRPHKIRDDRLAARFGSISRRINEMVLGRVQDDTVSVLV